MMIALIAISLTWSSLVAAGAGMATGSMVFTAITSGFVCLTMHNWNPNHQLGKQEGGDELLHLALLAIFMGLAVAIGATTGSYIACAATPPLLSMAVLVGMHLLATAKLRVEVPAKSPTP